MCVRVVARRKMFRHRSGLEIGPEIELCAGVVFENFFEKYVNDTDDDFKYLSFCTTESIIL